ncbi:MAG: hypothetical protein HF981_02590 [Desulfobacteraceae bacterium]|nr:hypothetical protein [Desulfobacteraceae bacterium]MBC2749252.1 hypothetical protein [Desulfobacteraceae bacterium]
MRRDDERIISATFYELIKLKVQKNGEVNILQLFLEVWGRLAAMLHLVGAGKRDRTNGVIALLGLPLGAP